MFLRPCAAVVEIRRNFRNAEAGFYTTISDTQLMSWLFGFSSSPNSYLAKPRSFFLADLKNLRFAVPKVRRISEQIHGRPFPS